MKLNKKKELAKRTLNVGKSRIVFLESRLDEIKDAITKQDIRDLKKEGAIVVKEIKGKRKVRKKKKKSVGNIRKKVKTRKKDYVTMARKLRNYLSELKKSGKISREDEKELRKKIRNKAFRSKAHLKEQIGGLKE